MIQYQGNQNRSMYQSFYQTHKQGFSIQSQSQNQQQQQQQINQKPKMEVLIIGKNSDPELEFILQQSELWVNNNIDTNEELQCFNDCVEIEIVTMHQTHFQYILKELKRKCPEIISHQENTPIILINSMRYIPNLVRLIATFILELKLPKEIFVRSLPYTFNEQNDFLLQLTQMTHNIKLKSGFLECKIKQKSMNQLRLTTPQIQKINQFRIIIQLNSRIMPKTSFNFYQLCQGNFKNSKNQRLTYKNTAFHALQKNAYIQGGAFQEHEKDQSVFGPTFEDESYAIKHDQPGIVGMANQGIPHTNASQFYITLGSQPDKDHKYVAFGLVVFGMKYLRKLNRLSDKSTSSPPFETRIVNCGEYNFQKDDFVKETKKDFDLLDNADVINTQLALAKRQRQERSFSTQIGVRSKIKQKGEYNTIISVKKDKDPFTTPAERFKSTLPKQKDFKIVKYPNQVQQQKQAARLNNTLLDHVSKDTEIIKDLIKPENKQIFKQYKKELDEQPFFQFQNVNLLAERGGNGKNNKKLQQQVLQSHQTNQYGNTFVKLQVSNLNLKSNLPSFQTIPESSPNLDHLSNLQLQPNKLNSIQNHYQNKDNNNNNFINRKIHEFTPDFNINNLQSLNTDQYLIKLLNLPTISPNKTQQSNNNNNNNNNTFISQSPLLTQPIKETRYQTESYSHLTNRNKQEKELRLGTTIEGIRLQSINKLTKQNTPQNQTLQDYLNNNFSLGNGQALQFRRPVIDRTVGTSSYNNRPRIGLNYSILSIQNAIQQNQNTLSKQNTINNNNNNQNNFYNNNNNNNNNQLNILDEVSQKIISTSKEELGSLIIISQISQFKKFIAAQYQRKLQDEQLVELNNIIPGLAESIAMQLPISLKKSLSQTQEMIVLNKQLTQDIQIPHTDTRNTLMFMSKQVGFDISEVEDDW